MVLIFDNSATEMAQQALQTALKYYTANCLIVQRDQFNAQNTNESIIGSTHNQINFIDQLNDIRCNQIISNIVSYCNI